MSEKKAPDRINTNSIIYLVILLLLAGVVVASVPAIAQDEVDEPAPDEPTNFYGDAVSEDGTLAPIGTEIVAVVDGEVRDSIIVEESGVYAEGGGFEEQLSLDSGAGDNVRFHVGDASGPEAIESPQPLEGGSFEQLLTFPAGTFDSGPTVENVVLSLADDEIQVGQDTTATVVAALDDGTDRVVTHDVVLSSDTDIASVDGKTITATGAGTTDIEATYAGQTDTVALTAEASAPSFDVTLTDVDESVDQGETTTVGYEIVNTGTEAGTQDIVFSVNGSEAARDESVSLDPDATTTGTFSYETDSEDPPAIDVTVASDDDSASDTVTVNAPAAFAVEIQDTNSPVTAGQTVAVDVDVENTGDLEATQTISIDVDGVGSDIDTTDVTLSGGETTSRTLNWNTDFGDDGDVDLTVSSADDTVTETVTVEESDEDFFSPRITSVDEAVTEGDEVTVDYEIKNTGAAQGTQDIVFAVDGETIATEDSVQLDSTTTSTGTFTYTTTSNDPSNIDVEVSTDDDTASDTVTVNVPAAFDVAINNFNQPLIEGETLTVDATVSNTGDLEATQTIRLAVDPDQGDTFDTTADTTTITLAGDESQSVTLTYTTATGDAEAIDFEVSSNEDREDRTVTVSEPAPASFDVAITDFDDAVETGTDASVEYEIENTGDEEGTQDVAFSVDGTIEDTDVAETLAGGETKTGTFTYSTGSDDTPEIDVEVSTDDDSAQEVIAVNEPANFQINAVTPSSDPIVVGQQLTFDVELENVGDLSAGRDITLSRDGETIQTTLVGLRGGDTDTVQLTYVPGSNDLNGQDSRELTFNVDAEDTTQQASVTIEAAEATFEITDTMSLPDQARSGDQIDATVTIENTGTARAEQTVSLLRDSSSSTVDQTEVDTATVDLGVGEETEITLTDIPSVNREGETLTYKADTAAGRTEVGSVELLRSAEFAVNLLSQSNTVTAGNNVGATVRITNEGDITETDTVRLTLDGAVIDQRTDIELAGNEDTVLELSGATTLDDTGDPELRVRTGDDSEAAEVAINAPATYLIEDVTATDPVAGSDPLEVTATVTNDGGVSGTQDIRLDAGSIGTDTASDVSLDPGETDEITFSVSTSESDIGDQSATVSTDDDATLAQSTVREPADIGVSIDSITDPVRAEQDELEVVATLDNTGGVSGTTDVNLEYNGNVQDTASSVTVDAGATETVTFDGTTLGSNLIGDVNVDVTAADQTVDETITVLEAPDAALFRVSQLEIDDPTVTDDILRQSDETVDVSATVENIGDLTGTQDIVLTTAGETRETTSVALDGGETETVTFELDPTTLTLGERTIAVESEESAQTATRPVRDPDPATFSTEINADDLARGGTATATIENTGDLTDTQTVTLELLISGEVITSDEGTATLAAGESTTLSVTVPSGATRAGTYDGTVEVSSADQDESDSVTIDFGSINDGIDAAEVGDTVNVAPGTYDTSIALDTDEITLSGGGVVIEGPTTGITVTGTDATINRFTFRNLETGVQTTADGLEISNSQFLSSVTDGILVEADNTVISNNLFIGNTESIRLIGADGTDVRNNDIIDSESRAIFSNGGVHEVNNNNIESQDVAIEVDPDRGSINATNNWWGRPGGPRSDEILSPVTVEPWETNAEAEPDYQIVESNLDEINTVTEDDPSTVSYTIKNEGGTVGTTADSLVLKLDGDEIAQTAEFEIGEDGELASGDTYEGTTFTPLRTEIDEVTANSLDTADLVLETDDDRSVASNVQVQTAPEFDVSIQDAPSSIDSDQTLQVDADISNVGEAQGTPTAELRFDGDSSDSASPTINGGESDPVTLTRDLSDDDVGSDLLIEVAVGDNTATRTITVNQASNDETTGGNDETTSGGQSTGGGSGDDEPKSTQEIRNTLSYTTPSSETETTIEDGDSETPGVSVRPEGTESVREVTFDNEDATGSLSVTEYNNPPESVREDIATSIEASESTTTDTDAEAGDAEDSSSTDRSIAVISTADITPDNTATAESSATVTFSLSTEAVNNPSQVTVFKETTDSETGEDTWAELETTLEDVSDEEVIVSARAESFSLFAVAEVEGEEGATPEAETTQNDGSTQDDEATADDDGSTQDDESAQDGGDGPAPTILVIGLLLVIAIAGAVFYARSSG